ncbi:MAG: sulfatase [Planctomycetaceae bacterium]
MTKRGWCRLIQARTTLKLLGFLSIAVLIVGITDARADSERPPNVVIVFADDLGYADPGCFGSRQNKTPHLDQLAKDGRRFTSFCVAQAVCSASRAALLTGCYPNRIGIRGALGPDAKVGINSEDSTIAEVLKSRGYATAIFGKWHLGHHAKFLPTQHGFDEYFGLPYSNDMWPKHPTAGNRFPELPLIDGEKSVELNPDQTKLTTSYTEHAVRFIEKNAARPFFLYVPHSMPHVPLFVSEKFAGKTGAGLYADVIAEIDWSVGEIVATLARLGLEKNTIVIFTSDNGPWLSYGNHAGSSGPLREGKGTMWEGGARVPCIMRWPGHIPAGTECSELAATIDLLPTLAGIAGADVPTARRIDGKDIRALMLGERDAKSPHEAYYYYWGDELQAIRSGRWKLHFPHSYRSMEGSQPGRDGQPGPYVTKETGLALYDLDADVGETTNVAGANPDVVARLEQLAEIARDDLGDALTNRTGRNLRPPGKL